MGIVSIEYGVVVDLLQIAIITLIGFILAKIGPLAPRGELLSAQANLYIFIPLFCFFEVSNSTRSISRLSVLLLWLTFAVSSLVAAFLTWMYCRLFAADVRTVNSLVLIAAFGAVAFFPGALVHAACSEDGDMWKDPDCGLGPEYSMYMILWFNLILLCIGGLFASRDRAISHNIMRQMWFVRKFYPSPAEFMADRRLDAMERVQREKFAEYLNPDANVSQQECRSTTYVQLIGKEGSHKAKFMEPRNLVESPVTLFTDPELIRYSFSIHMSPDTYNSFQYHFDAFLDKMSPPVFSALYTAAVPGPQKPEEVSGWFFFLGWLKSPIILSIIAGFIFGFFPDLSNWLYSPRVVELFMGTVEALAGFAVPLAVMVLGAELAKLEYTGKDTIIRVSDVIAIIVIRMGLVPLLGLGFVWIIALIMGSWLTNDRVLTFSVFANWCVPPGILVATLFVLMGHYSKEGTIILIWCMIASLVTVLPFILAYFAIEPAKR